MLKLTLAATSLVIVGSLLVAPHAIAAGRSPSSVTLYPVPSPLPSKLPVPGLFPIDGCNGVALVACARPNFLPPIVQPGLQPSDPCKGRELCISGPIQQFSRP